MTAPTPLPAQRIVLRATCSAHTPSGATKPAVIKMGMAKLPNGRIEFTPHLTGACVFTVDEDELIKVLVRWV
ncbi:MAG: hypothetical protein WCF33_14330 [Pseudonocardiaceae bacterium]|jgi:hypothetical protein